MPTGVTGIKGATGPLDSISVTPITGSAKPLARQVTGRLARGAGARTRRRTRPRVADQTSPPVSPTPTSPAHPERVIFLDIPMTAGPAMRAVVKHQYAPDDVISVYRPLMEQTLADLQSLDEARKRRSKFILGHVSFGVHELLPQPGECKYVTVLRDPVERVIDEYEYIRRTRQHFLHDQVRRMTLKDFAATGLANGTQNGQTKYLTQSRWSSLPSSDRATEPMPSLTDGALEQAKRNLEQHFLVVGLTEELDATLLLMKRRLGWTLPFYAGKAPPPPPPQSLRSTVSPDAVRAIEKHNALDMQLYDWSRRRFEQAVWGTGLLFQAELRGFQALNAWYAFHRRGGR